MVVSPKFRTILLFGMPGSGKGTQGVVLGHLPGVVHISSGDLFRRLPKHGELGREVVSYTSRGLLVPDELTIRIWKRHVQILTLQEEIAPGSTTLVLDGLPRNFAQAEMLDSVLDVLQIFHLKITDIEAAKDRLAARALRENRLDDINEEVVRRRLQVYNEETIQTLRFYDPALIYEIDASQTPLKVHSDIVQRLCELETDRRHISEPPGFIPEPNSQPQPASAK
ncbi:adenylate kinase family protein [Tautonia sociabilis]|uniref:Adenylate kinase n=1 Tax=Tautonia sociabilis TaxID=2080755 RepID=A0A432MPH7_9BACT|nr:nucleoside monophosphate kinase [Tautonia sociabilis]RUL89067.1 nucleoside monophosphate kinase [Tautonia sociabilis]